MKNKIKEKVKDKTKKLKNKKKNVKIEETIENKSQEMDESEEEMDSTEDPIKSNVQIIESLKKEDDDDSDKVEDKLELEDSKKVQYDKEDEAKTVFCGNIPNDPTITKGRIKDLFTPFGTIKSLRVRTETGNVLFSKKMKKHCKSFNAYIVFENEEDAKKSVELNGTKLLENPLRVNMANSRGSFSNKGTIFVGNLPFDATEADVHEYFSQIGDIEYVRKLPKKGIAFVCYKKGVSLANALKLNDQDFQGRKLRVSRSESKDKQERKKLFKRDPKTGKIVKQKIKKSHKLNDKLLKGRPNINNPIVKKIKDTQKAKYNKFTDTEVSKKELFRRGGKMDKDTRDMKRDKLTKKQKFFGSKVEEPNNKTNKTSKGKISKTAKQQKVIAKKLKSAAMRQKT